MLLLAGGTSRKFHELSFIWISPRHSRLPFPFGPLFLSFPLVKRFNLGSPSSDKDDDDDDDGNGASQGTIWILCHTPAAILFNKWLEYLFLLAHSTLSLSLLTTASKRILQSPNIHFCDLTMLDAPPRLSSRPIESIFHFYGFSVINLPLMNCAIKNCERSCCLPPAQFHFRSLRLSMLEFSRVHTQ